MWSEIDGALIVDRFTLPACEVDAQLRVIAVNRPFCEAFKYSDDGISEAVTLGRFLGSAQVERIRDLLSNEDEHIRVAPFSATVLSGAGQSINCQIHLGLTGNASTRLGLLFFLPCISTDYSNLATNDCLHNDRLEKFWKSLPNGVIAVTSEGRVEDFNNAAVSTLEYLPCELRHKGIDKICPELSPFEHYSRADNRSRPHILTLVTKRGDLLPVRASLQEIPFENQTLHLLCFAEDSAAQYRRAWQKSEDQLRSLIDNLHDGIALTDRDFHIRFCNDRLAAIFNCPKELLRGIDLAAFLQDRSGGSLKLPLSSVLVGEILEQNMTILDRNKISHAVQITIVPLTEPEDRFFETAVIVRDITRFRQTVEKLRQQRENLKRLTGEIINAQERERQSISRELHDNIAQRLAAVRLKVACIAPELDDNQKKELEQATELLEDIADDIRHITADLRPQILDDLGLIPALEWYINEFSRCSRIEADIRITGESRRLSNIAEINLFRIFQELLLNAAKHSGAIKVEVHLHFDARHVSLVVADNGCGFKNHSGDSEPLPKTPHFGLLNISERMANLGGDMKLDNREEGGAIVCVRVPE